MRRSFILSTILAASAAVFSACENKPEPPKPPVASPSPSATASVAPSPSASPSGSPVKAGSPTGKPSSSPTPNKADGVKTDKVDNPAAAASPKTK